MWDDEFGVFGHFWSERLNTYWVDNWVMDLDLKSLGSEDAEEVVEAWCMVWTYMATKGGAITFLTVL